MRTSTSQIPILTGGYLCGYKWLALDLCAVLSCSFPSHRDGLSGRTAMKKHMTF